jgi:thiopurine S-methyltransferase
MIAMPEEVRALYVEKLKQTLKPGGRILLVTLDYIQSEMAGPPYSVSEIEIQHHFKGYKITRLERDDAGATHPRIQQGLTRFAEEVWLIESD